MLVHNKNFNIEQIADSGQCFRMNRMSRDDNKISYRLIAYGRYLELTQVNAWTVELSCSEQEFHELWEDYFDLTYDYGKIVDELITGEDVFLSQAASFAQGVRILQQEPFEAMISFIISQNKNIPAIRNCVEALCERYGERIAEDACSGKTLYAFPTPTVLAMAEKADLRALKTGYRDEYIIKAAQAVVNGSVDFETVKSCGHEAAVATLRGIHGIGEKVANCISLYGLHHIEGFPVDVWILRILKDVYQNEFRKEKYAGYAGIIQQYMFYYYRHLNGVSKK
jgi:N-glycosylase/DNA lyase